MDQDCKHCSQDEILGIARIGFHYVFEKAEDETKQSDDAQQAQLKPKSKEKIVWMDRVWKTKLGEARIIQGQDSYFVLKVPHADAEEIVWIN